MTKAKWTARISKALIVIASGTTLLGTSCGVELRNAVIGAGADFVGNSLIIILENIFPVEDLLANEPAE